jgi:hypothetical protein
MALSPWRQAGSFGVVVTMQMPIPFQRRTVYDMPVIMGM